MTVITLLSGTTAPGMTTTAAVLAVAWPRPVLLVDADPAGGDLLPGWLGPWWIDGALRGERGIVSFATATRHLPTGSLPAEALAGHLYAVPTAGHVRLLAGVTHRGEAQAIGAAGWQRLATALDDLSGPDVLIDAGRLDPDTAWPLITSADLVLVGVRASMRHLLAADRVRTMLREVPAHRIALAVCAAHSGDATSVASALDLSIGVQLPNDPATAALFSDGTSCRRYPLRSPLGRAAAQAAAALRTRLHHTANTTAAPQT